MVLPYEEKLLYAKRIVFDTKEEFRRFEAEVLPQGAITDYDVLFDSYLGTYYIYYKGNLHKLKIIVRREKNV